MKPEKFLHGARLRHRATEEVSMACPVCGVECEEGTSLCEDCEAQMMEELDAEPAEEEVEFVALGEMTDAEVFAAVTAQLEDEGIPWFVQCEKGPITMMYVDKNRLVEARRELAAVSLMAVCEGD
jgi:predicted aconitase